MPSVKAVENAFKDAVDRALCRASREPLARIEAVGRVEAEKRIHWAMTELEKLSKGEEQPEYRDPDVALFYSQWYLPEQINVGYSESVRCIERTATLRTASLQLVDFGAGSGAMVIGLALAVATHMPREHWPERVSAYQIDHPAMLEFGESMWHAILEKVSGPPALRDVADVMSRAELRGLALDDNLDFDAPAFHEDAERWLTALHVAYEDDMQIITNRLRRLLRQLKPHVAIRTVSESKKHHLKLKRRPRAVSLRLLGDAEEITALRRELGDRTNARHPFLYTPVHWGGGEDGDGEDGGGKRHFAATAC